MPRAISGRRGRRGDVGGFLIGLGLDAGALREFLLDSTGTMAARLSRGDQALLRAGVPAAVSRAVVGGRRTSPSRPRPARAAGELVVVGSGIDVFSQLTPAARASIEAADEVLYLVGDAVAARFIRALNARAEPLITFYAPDKARARTYEEIVRRILASLRRGRRVCAVFYGHPGVLTDPGHEAIRRARRQGFVARMLPGISTEACLFADVGVDPGRGYQSFAATDFVVHRRDRFDASTALVLWQVDALGDPTYQERGFKARHLRVLIEILVERYGAGHEVILYRAPVFPTSRPDIRRVRLGRIHRSDVAGATLYVPPRGPLVADADVLERLGTGRRRPPRPVSVRSPSRPGAGRP
jgi:hypothetical protein